MLTIAIGSKQQVTSHQEGVARLSSRANLMLDYQIIDKQVNMSVASGRIIETEQNKLFGGLSTKRSEEPTYNQTVASWSGSEVKQARIIIKRARIATEIKIIYKSAALVVAGVMLTIAIGSKQQVTSHQEGVARLSSRAKIMLDYQIIDKQVNMSVASGRIIETPFSP